MTPGLPSPGDAALQTADAALQAASAALTAAEEAYQRAPGGRTWPTASAQRWRPSGRWNWAA